MARNTGRRLRSRHKEGCPGWPERTHAAWGGPVVTCRCGARFWRPQTRRERLWRALTRRAKGTRLLERLRRFWPSLLELFFVVAVFLGSLIYVIVRYYAVWRFFP